MPDLLSCPLCAHDVSRDDFPAHQRDCRGAKPKLPVSGWLVRCDAGRVRVLTLGSGPFGAVWLAAQVLVDVTFGEGEEGKMVAYLLSAIEEQGE